MAAVVRLPRPRAYQLPVLLSPSRGKLLLCGRRWGKSTLGLVASLLGHGPTMKEHRGALQGADIYWIAPSNGVASLYWRTVRFATRGVWVDKSERERRISFPGGGSIQVKSAVDPDSLRGPGLDGAVLDEAAFMSEEVYGVIRPALADRQGWTMMLTTPPPVQNWLTDLFDDIPNRPEWQSWQRPSTDNLDVTESEIASAALDMSESEIQREFYAQVVAAGSGGWDIRWFSRRWTDRLQIPPLFRLIAIDTASTREDVARIRRGSEDTGPDWSVFAHWGSDGNDYYLLDLIRMRGEYPEVRAALVAVYPVWQPDEVAVEDAMTGRALIQDLRSVIPGLIGIPPIGDKILRTAAVTPLGAAGKIVLPASAPWLQEWLNEHRRFPKAGHDDMVDTTSLALSRLRWRKSRKASGRNVE